MRAENSCTKGATPPGVDWVAAQTIVCSGVELGAFDSLQDSEEASQGLRKGLEGLQLPWPCKIAVASVQHLLQVEHQGTSRCYTYDIGPPLGLLGQGFSSGLARVRILVVVLGDYTSCVRVVNGGFEKSGVPFWWVQ